MTTTAIFDFSMVRGDSKTLQVTVKDGDGVVVDLTGANAIKWQMARSAHAGTADVEKSVGAGITAVELAAGRFDVTLVPADTINRIGDFYHEAEVTDASNNVATVLSGTITILPGLIA